MDHNVLVAETDHSVIWTDREADIVIKSFRNPHDPRTRSRWEKERDALQSIGNYPGIVRLISSSSATDNLTITLSPAPGQVLSSYDPVTLTPYVHQICLQLARALSHIHTLGLIHDDVKPDNVMFALPTSDSVEKPKVTTATTLIDFGACIRRDTPFNKSGTPWYMAPEFMRKLKDTQVDVWALGVTIVWVLGELPLPERSREEWILPLIWEDSKAMALMEAWLAEVSLARERLMAKAKANAAATELEHVVVDMLEPDAERRISAQDIVTRLEKDRSRWW